MLLDVRMRPRIGFAPVQDITRRANVCVHAANIFISSLVWDAVDHGLRCTSILMDNLLSKRLLITDAIARRATSDSARSYGCLLLSDFL